MNSRRLLATVTIGGAAAALSLVLLRRRLGRLRYDRGLAALQLALRGGARYARSAPRLFAAAGEQRQLLRGDLALQTAEDVATTLGAMKGVLMKVGQMASYVDDGLSPAVRRTLARLQDSVPPMSPELAAAVVEEELGAPPERAFARWDPQPIAAASIGQVHRAITLDGRAVAVKVQYPGIAETIAADLRNVALLRRMLRITAPAQDVGALLAELRERVAEELDYRREAASQRRFAACYDGHPTIHVPGIVGALSTRRVVTSELAEGARFAELSGWSQAERDLAAETIYRFCVPQPVRAPRVQRRPAPRQLPVPPRRQGHLPGFRAGQALHPGRAAAAHGNEPQAVRRADPEAFRRSLENAGFLRPNAPLSTETIIEHLAVFHDTIREPGPLTITGDYASSVVRRFFDVRSPVTEYLSVPGSYVILQRINLGLFAVLGELSATADWRAIAEEIWPFAQARPPPRWETPRPHGGHSVRRSRRDRPERAPERTAQEPHRRYERRVLGWTCVTLIGTGRAAPMTHLAEARRTTCGEALAIGSGGPSRPHHAGV